MLGVAHAGKGTNTNPAQDEQRKLREENAKLKRDLAAAQRKQKQEQGKEDQEGKTGKERKGRKDRKEGKKEMEKKAMGE